MPHATIYGAQGLSITCEVSTLAQISNRVQPITSADYEVYRLRFSKGGRMAVYADSWAYITQACRGPGLGLGLRYLADDSLYSFGRHRGHYVVVNPLGSLKELPTILDHLNREFGKPVFIKKLVSDDADVLSGLQSVQPASTYRDRLPVRGAYVWDNIAYADDDTYPEQIIDLDLTVQYSVTMADWFGRYCSRLNGTGPADPDSTRRAYRQFRRCVRHFEHECQIVAFHQSLLPDLWRFIGGYFHGSRADATAAYVNLLTTLKDGTGADSQFCYVITSGASRSIAGVVFVERLDPCSAGIYARLITRSIPCLPEYAMSQVLIRLRQEGVQRVNLGGSETLGLHSFKQKLAPVEERHIPLLVCGHAKEPVDGHSG